MQEANGHVKRKTRKEDARSSQQFLLDHRETVSQRAEVVMGRRLKFQKLQIHTWQSEESAISEKLRETKPVLLLS